MTLRELKEDVEYWCADSNGWIRLPVLLLILHQSYQQIKDPWWDGLFSALDFGVHELGHVIFSPFGEFMGIFGGSFWQLAAPIITAIMFYRQRDYFAISVASMWLGISLFRMAVYMEDARTMQLPLMGVGGGGEAWHDWNYMFTDFRVLQHDWKIALATRSVGKLFLVFAMVSGTWMIYRMFRSVETNES